LRPSRSIISPPPAWCGEEFFYSKKPPRPFGLGGGGYGYFTILYSIDLFKFIMAFAVVAIHTEPFVACSNDNFLNEYDILVQLAVPFFFLASGYLLAIKMEYPCGSERDLIRLKGQLFKVIKMYLTWTLIYLPLAIYRYASSGTSFIKSVLLYIRRFIFVGEQYNSWPLWYLLSTIYALSVIGVALKCKRKPGVLIGISVVASVISIGFTTLVNYEGNLTFAISLFRKMIQVSVAGGRVFRGMIYIPVGMVLAHKKLPSTVNWAGFIAGFVLNCFIDNSIVSSYLLILTAVSLFGIVEGIELKDRKIYSKLRNMSTLIYLIHMYVWTFYYKIVYGGKTYGVDSFIATAVVSTIASLVYVIVRDNKKHKSIEQKI
jgi:surface polysaccharide O-acyltransferase-like enzyme